MQVPNRGPGESSLLAFRDFKLNSGLGIAANQMRGRKRSGESEGEAEEEETRDLQR